MGPLTSLSTHLTITGIIPVGLGVVHVALPRALGWRTELGALSLVNRQVSYVHCYFIGLSCVLWGLLPLTAGQALLQPQPVTRLLLVGAVIFWASRLLIQLAVFNPSQVHASRSWLVTAVAGTLLWLYLTTTWAIALAHQV